MFLAISLVLVNQISHIFLGEESNFCSSLTCVICGLLNYYHDNGFLGNQDKHCFCEIYCYQLLFLMNL